MELASLPLLLRRLTLGSVNSLEFPEHPEHVEHLNEPNRSSLCAQGILVIFKISNL
jgi:hypothetical protein